MTNQEIFDTVSSHLLTQKVQCVGGHEGTCEYRNQEGLKCAAGCLIPDELYTELIEGCIWNPEHDDNSNILLQGGELFAQWHNSFSKQNNKLIGKLQRIHDEGDTRNWKLKLLRLGEQFKLNTQILEKFQDE